MMLLEGGILHFKGGTTSPGAATLSEGGIIGMNLRRAACWPQRAAEYLLRVLHLEGGVMPRGGSRKIPRGGS